MLLSVTELLCLLDMQDVHIPLVPAGSSQSKQDDDSKYCDIVVFRDASAVIAVIEVVGISRGRLVYL